MYKQKCYDNAGNLDVALLVPQSAISILDIGCGAGATGALIREANAKSELHGITLNREEQKKALKIFDKVMIADVEKEDIAGILEMKYDVIICSHILEHLKSPDDFVASITEIMKPTSILIVAVPNLVHWRIRLKILLGAFDYEETGVMDETHLRFFSYFSADKFLLRKTKKLQVTIKRVTGVAPLWLIRKILPDKINNTLNHLACTWLPNLFGSQILFTARLGPLE